MKRKFSEKEVRERILKVMASAETDGDWDFVNKTIRDYRKVGYEFDVYELSRERIKRIEDAARRLR